MQNAIKVNIGGREYSLRGQDEDIIKQAAKEVNTQLDNLKGKTKESATTLPLLAALNIAEKYYIKKKQHEIDINFLANEINEMVNYLSKPVEDAGKISSE